MTVACVPWKDPVVLQQVLPAAMEVVYYDGSDLPERLEEITFFVPPYMGPASTLEVMASMPALQVVQALTAGVDNIWPHLPPGVTLCNARGVHDASTAELAVGLIIASLRHIDDFARAQATGQWLHGRYQALADKTVLIVGAGSVGGALADRLAPFEVELIKVARTARDGVYGFEQLPALLPDADVVVLLCPLTDQTRGLVNADFISRMRPGALLVNVSRGPVVVTDDLVDAVQQGRIFAALDVTDPEPLPPEHPLWRAPGVLISPHVGGNTSAFLPRAYRLVAKQLARFSQGEPVHHVMSR